MIDLTYRRQAKLALFDTALLLDDSGSMAFTKWNGERLDDLNVCLLTACCRWLFPSPDSLRLLNFAAHPIACRDDDCALR